MDSSAPSITVVITIDSAFKLPYKAIKDTIDQTIPLATTGIIFNTILTGRTYKQFELIEGSLDAQNINVGISFSQETDQMTTVENIVFEAITQKMSDETMVTSRVLMTTVIRATTRKYYDPNSKEWKKIIIPGV